MNKIFKDKKALVIGGSGGIGRFVSLGLANLGAELTVIGVSEEHLKRIKAETHAETFLIKLDADNAVDSVLKACPSTDILVCALGPFKRKMLAETTPAEWKHIVTLNLILPGSLISVYLGGMMERHWGRILLFGGTNTSYIRGWTTTTPYSAAKTALGVLAKSTAKNAAAFGVTCNVICPGLTDTEYMDEEARQYNRENSPTGVPITPEAVGAFAIDVLKNQHLNGAMLPIDEGIEVHTV
jgi:NAD(P)-dependent dehydrogenase (short-subunit alcohol dehydrogenase family)